MEPIDTALLKEGILGAFCVLALWAIRALFARLVASWEKQLRTDQICDQILTTQKELLGAVRQIQQQGRSFARWLEKHGG